VARTGKRLGKMRDSISRRKSDISVQREIPVLREEGSAAKGVMKNGREQFREVPRTE